MNIAYLLLGGNIGNRKENLQKALLLTEKHAGLCSKKSNIYLTKAWGNELQPDFYNQAVRIETIHTPEALLSCLLKIEEELGRERNGDKWQARTIDIDILFYNDERIDYPDLKIPHPFIQERRFVLLPMNEIAEDFFHPVLKKSIKQLLSECKDPLEAEQLLM